MKKKTLTAKDKQTATMCELKYNYRESSKGKEKIFKAYIRMLQFVALAKQALKGVIHCAGSTVCHL